MIFESFFAFLSKIFFFTSYVNSKGSFPQPLTPEEERECLLKLKEGDQEAREKLIQHNLRLVAYIVKKYVSAAEADDLISVGSIGLIKGIENFVMGKGTQLATYAARCIDNEILMYLRANKRHKGNVSLTDTIGTDKDGNEIRRIDILPHGDESILSQVETKVLFEGVMHLIDEVLDEREKLIVVLRYGLGGEEEMTQIDVAKILNISRSYVSRIEKKAIRKLRASLKGDPDFLD